MQSYCNVSYRAGGLDTVQAMMWADGVSFPTSAPIELPLDLSNWVVPGIIALWVKEEARGLEWDEAEPVWRLRGNRPPAMLALLAFAYATGVFDTDEILSACRRDPLFRSLGEGAAPFSQDVIRFRREHRGRLIGVLAQILTRAVLERYCWRELPNSLELRRRTLQSATDRLNIARHMETDE